MTLADQFETRWRSACDETRVRGAERCSRCKAASLTARLWRQKHGVAVSSRLRLALSSRPAVRSTLGRQRKYYIDVLLLGHSDIDSRGLHGRRERMQINSDGTTFPALNPIFAAFHR